MAVIMKHKFVIILILCISLILANWGKNTQLNKLPDINKIFPYEINKWEGKDVDVDKSVSDFFSEGELLLRRYHNTSGEETISLAIVTTLKRDHIHDPNICYRGQGISINSEKDALLKKILKVRVVNGQKRGQPQKIIYWYTDFTNTYTDRTRFMRNITISKLLNKPSKGFALVVIISPNNEVPKIVNDFALEVNKKLKNLNNE